MTVPEGYSWVCNDDAFRPWICDRCGASVVASAFSTHDAWHGGLAKDTLAEILRQLRRERDGA